MKSPDGRRLGGGCRSRPARRMLATALVAAGTLFGAQAALASAVSATPAAEPGSRSRLENGYALCKAIVAVVFPHHPDDIMRTASPGGYFVSSDGRAYSYIGHVTARPDGDVEPGRREFRNFLCILTLDPGSPSGWSLREFRWIEYQ